jgi:lysozyme
LSAIDIVLPRLKVDEGFRPKKYLDTRGLETIGYGFCIDAGISEHVASALLTAQVEECWNAVMAFWWANQLDEVRLSVVLELAFNNGVNGLLHYPKMITAIGAKDWQSAHDELLDSDAARALPNRYKALANLLLTGVA